MITYSDKLFAWSKAEDEFAEDNLKDFIAVAIGIDGVVQHVFGTYISFFDLLSSGYKTEDASEAYSDDKYYVNFLDKDGLIIETLEAPEKVWALLLSEPDIIEMVRDARIPPSYLKDGIKYYVKENWTYTKTEDSYEFTPPTGWALPIDAHETLEEKYEKQMMIIERMKDAYKRTNWLHPDFLSQLEKLQ